MNKFLERQPARDIYYLYEDEYLVAVSKPAWLLSVPGRGEDKQDCVLARVQQKYKTAMIVHRLDWATSGVIIFALTKDALRNLNKQFADRKTEKHYIAVVNGIVEKDEQLIDLPLICDWENRPRQIVDYERGKSSQTIVKVTKRLLETNQTRLELKPITGRSHQLRVHLAQIGHPIIGDLLYNPVIQKQEDRMLLHAEKLTVSHPETGEDLSFLDEVDF